MNNKRKKIRLISVTGSIMLMIICSLLIQSCMTMFVPKRMRTDYFSKDEESSRGTASYREFNYEGDSYSLGLKLGTQLKALGIEPGEMKGREKELYLFQYRLLAELHPSMIEYLRGMAAAYSMDFDKDKENYCFFVSVMNMDFSCSAVYTSGEIHRDGNVMLSRNYDFFNNFGNITHYQIEGQNQVLGHSFMYGYPYMMDGMNQHGLGVITNMEVESVKGASSFSYPMPEYNGLEALLVVRLLLETCRNAQDARNLLESIPVCSTGPKVHMLVGDASGDSFIAEFDFENTGAVTIIERKQDSKYQVMTNFAERTQGQNGNLGYEEGPCIRYSTLRNYYRNLGENVISNQDIFESLYNVRMSSDTREMNQGMSDRINTVIQIFYNLTNKTMSYRTPEEDFSKEYYLGFNE